MFAEDVYDAVVCQATSVAPGDSEASVLKFRDGRLLLAYTYFYAGEARNESLARISAKISEDGGLIWGKRFPLHEREEGLNVTTPSLLRLKSGDIALFFLYKKYRDVCVPYIKKSRDEGKTWSKPIALTKDERLYDMANDSVIQLSTGRIVVPACRFNRHKWNYSAFCFYSDDGGRSWSKGKSELELSRMEAMDPHIVELKSGKIIMTIRNQLGRVYQAYSQDQSSTWRDLDSTEVQASDSPIAIRRIPKTDDLLMVWNNSRDKRRPLTSAISKDEGESWSNFKDLETGEGHEYSHPSITFLNENTLLVYNLYDAKTGWISLKLMKIPIGWFY